MKRAWSKSNIPPFTFTHSNVTHSEGSRHAAVQGSLFGALFYRLHIAPCAFIRGTAGPFHWRYNTTSFHWCLLVPLIGYKPLSGPWGTIVNRGELLWNPTDFFVVGCWDHISYGGPRLSYQLMYRSICQSLFYRYSTDTRPTSNQCYYRYSLDHIATDIYIYWLGNEGWSTFQKIHTQNPCADL